MRRVKTFVRPHQRHQVFGIGQIDYVVSESGEHVNNLYFFAAHLKLPHLVRAYLPFLYERASRHHYKKLPLAVVPMLAFSYARVGNVYRKLSAVDGFY